MAATYVGRSWAQADAFLNKGRTKNSRQRRNVARNTRLMRQSNGDIALVLHQTAVVTYHQNGTATLHTGGWWTWATKDRINSYAPVRIFSEKNQWYVATHRLGTSPAKVQKCRRCRGEGRQESFCYPQSCWRGHHGAPCEHGNTTWHQVKGPCEKHGRADYTRHHGYTPCWGCDGTGKRDYGSKPIYQQWPMHVGPSGITVDSDGQVLETGVACPGWSDPAPGKAKPVAPGQPGLIGGGTVMAGLRQVVPDLEGWATCPVCAVPGRISGLIPELNDTHLWSREQIADWLETLDLDLRFQVPA